MEEKTLVEKQAEAYRLIRELDILSANFERQRDSIRKELQRLNQEIARIELGKKSEGE